MTELNLEVGQKVWSIQLGECEVHEIGKEVFTCTGTRNRLARYYINGKYAANDSYPSVFLSNPFEPKIDMNHFKELDWKIRQAIPELKEELEAFEDGSIDRDMITQIGLNHVLEYAGILDKFISIHWDGDILFNMLSIGIWNLKSAYLKHQSEELINFLNDLK